MDPVGLAREVTAEALGRRLTGTGSTRVGELATMQGKKLVGMTERRVRSRTCLCRRRE